MLLAFAASALAAAPHALPAKPDDAGHGDGERAQARFPGLAARLEALAPQTPWAYFELGEEVAAEFGDAESRSLARRLFVLAYALETPTGPLRASACYALASVANDERERRRLLALAEAFLPPDSLVTESATEARARSVAAVQASPALHDAPFALASALGLYRSGDYARAAAIFERSDVRALLDRFSDQVGGAEALLREVRSRPTCRECRNQRVVRGEDAGGGGPPPMRLCATCGGNPGPALEPARRLAIVRVESALLSGSQQSWATQLLADRGARLIELNPEDVPALFGVDVSATLFRDGAWIAPPRAADGAVRAATSTAAPATAE